ncbi:hypothetical protein FBUS_05086 [Fasciolopsis buskii]|uniref:CSC1/OSCA1-like 7TM region domain-containing protein n=1 Tax=Fasciolopsis buskii TaxID=27845 RepID=A0A8E0RJZ6_9TREM|nr:hypothetical protein FBUS_05086 [Fasciolopsis buski]
MEPENLTFRSIVKDCRGYWPTHPPGSSYLWEFEGIPFNLFLNTLTVPVSLFYSLARNERRCPSLAKSRSLRIFLAYQTEGTVAKNNCPAVLFHGVCARHFHADNADRRLRKLENEITMDSRTRVVWTNVHVSYEFAQYAGLDGVAYMRALVYNVCQLLCMLPFLVVGLPIYFHGEATAPLFVRLSIINLGLSDTLGSWILWAMIVTCSTFYLIWIGLRFKCAYHWPKQTGICRSWNERAHVNQDCSLLWDTDDMSTDPTTVPSNCVGSCQCLLVNQLPNVLMLSNVPEKPFDELKRDLQSYFNSFDPPVNVQWIRPLYDVYDIVTREKLRLKAKLLLQIANREYERTGREPRYFNGLCGCGTCLKRGCFSDCCYCCSCCVNETHYNSELAREVYRERILADKIWLDDQYKRLINSDTGDTDVKQPIGFSTGVVFVGLNNADEALRVATEFSIYLQRAIPMDYTIHPSTHTVCLPLNRWSNMLTNERQARIYAAAPFGHLQLAPLPADILWANLMTSRYRSATWWIAQLLKSILIFLLALLLTSPTYLLVVLNYMRASDWVPERFGFVVYQWIPALILVTAAASVKQLVILSEAWTKHGTYGGREKVGQRTLFLFLLISVLLFPSLGVTGLPFLLEQLIGQRGDGKPLRVECIFVPDSAALFINYIITSAILGNVVQLLQLGRWIWFFICRLFCVHSSAEACYLAQQNAGPFPFRERYASMNLITSIVVAYTPIAPIILPFGLLYFLADYLICRYTMLFVYTPHWFDEGHGLEPKEHYATANRVYHMTWFILSNNLSMVAICLACLNLSFFFGLRIQNEDMRTPAIAFLVLALLITVICILIASLMDGRCIHFDGHCSSPLPKSAGKTSGKPSDKTVKRASVMIPGSITFCERVYTAAFLGHSRSLSLAK